MDSDMSELMALSHISDRKLEMLKSLNRQVELFGNSEDLVREEREIKQWLNWCYNYLMCLMSQASQEAFEDQEEDDIQGFKSSSYGKNGVDTEPKRDRIESHDSQCCERAEIADHWDGLQAKAAAPEHSLENRTVERFLPISEVDILTLQCHKLVQPSKDFNLASALHFNEDVPEELLLRMLEESITPLVYLESNVSIFLPSSILKGLPFASIEYNSGAAVGITLLLDHSLKSVLHINIGFHNVGKRTNSTSSMAFQGAVFDISSIIITMTGVIHHVKQGI